MVTKRLELMNKVVKALLLLAVANISIGLYAYSVFLQVPIFKGHPLMLQHVLEPIFYVIVAVIGNYLVFKSIYFSDKNKIIRFNESKFLAPVIFLLLIIGIGFGIHTSSQMVADMLGDGHIGYENNSSSLVYKLASFLDEGPGHWFVSIPILFLYFFFSLIEFNRKEVRLMNYEKVSILLAALIIGVGLGISGFEGSFNGFNQNYLILPTAAILLYKIYKYKTSFVLKFWGYPFVAFLTVALVIYYIFVFIFSAVYGFKTNPGTDLNWTIKLPF